MTTPERRLLSDRMLMLEVLTRVRTWDPVGLEAMGAPADEYECLVGPISSAVRRGVTAGALAEAVASQVADHFGSRPDGSLDFATDLLQWHSTWPDRVTLGDAD